MDPSPRPQYWAVLVGINFYREGDCLKGCVRDVNNIRQYLLEPGSTPVHIEAFTADTPPDSKARCPIGQPETWPTYANVTSSLKKVTDTAKPGDYVYIHYSGHGTRSVDRSGNLALCLFDERLGTRYLRGAELAGYLSTMVKKGLLITVVLDCCFSGGVLRLGEFAGDAAVRTVAFDPAIDAAYPPELGTDQSLLFSRPLRDARIVPQWLISPDGYTILAACGPHEKAFELRFKTDLERNGALSYFLHRALVSLRRSGVDITHQSLYQHISVRFHAEYPKQNPVRFGNSELTFFGKVGSGLNTVFVSVFERQADHQLLLGAGHAHGVSQGDEYAVYPLDTPEAIRELKDQAHLLVKVDVVHSLTSELVYHDTRSGGRAKTGWKARPLTHFPLEKISVRLHDRMGDEARWRTASDQRRFLRFVSRDKDEQCLFAVTCNSKNEYEFHDQSDQMIKSLPTCSAHGKHALEDVLTILDHVCAYKYIETIENRFPLQDFASSFSIQLCNPSKKSFSEAGILEIAHKEELQLMVRNLSSKPLYVSIYNLSPEWQIKSLTNADGGGDFLIVESGKTFQGKIRMAVPESFLSKGDRYCEEILKFFITRKQSSFTSLVLPKIDDALKRKDDSRQLSNFLFFLARPTRGAAGDVPGEEWIVRNFVIRTHC